MIVETKYATSHKGSKVERHHDLRELNSGHFCFKVFEIETKTHLMFGLSPKAP